MLTKNIATIDEHHKLVGSKFQLAHLVMRRARHLLEGAPISKGVGAEFVSIHRGDIPNHRLAKVALEEIRTGKITWRHKNPTVTTEDTNNTVVFNG